MSETAPNLPADLVRAIDHTLLAPEATATDIARLCDEATATGFATVCVNPTWVPDARARVGDRTGVCAVIGFPLGATSSEAKRAEARRALADGADELDMVMSIGRLLSGAHDHVGSEISDVVALGAPVKVILECALLDEATTRVAASLAADAGAAFVKTSTGFGPGGATVGDVALLRAVVGPDVGVKASGGIRTADDALAMIAAGADRLGTSRSMAIVAELGERQ